MKTKKYFYAVYKDYSENKRIAQLSDTVDGLNCEILADPGCLTFYETSKQKAKENAILRAKIDNCNFLEINLNNYQVLKITKR